MKTYFVAVVIQYTRPGRNWYHSDRTYLNMTLHTRKAANEEDAEALALYYAIQEWKKNHPDDFDVKLHMVNAWDVTNKMK